MADDGDEEEEDALLFLFCDFFVEIFTKIFFPVQTLIIINLIFFIPTGFEQWHLGLNYVDDVIIFNIVV